MHVVNPLAFRVRDGAGGIIVGPRVLHGCLAALTHKAHFLQLVDYIRRYTARDESVYQQHGSSECTLCGPTENKSFLKALVWGACMVLKQVKLTLAFQKNAQKRRKA